MTEPTQRDPGYRGALPPAEDRLARPWVAAVFAIFFLIFVLAAAGIPSRFIPEPTPVPLPSVAPPPSGSLDASPSGDVSPSPDASPSADVSPSATP